MCFNDRNPVNEEKNLSYFRFSFDVFSPVTLLKSYYQARGKRFVCPTSAYILQPNTNKMKLNNILNQKNWKE